MRGLVDQLLKLRRKPIALERPQDKGFSLCLIADIYRSAQINPQILRYTLR